MKTLIVGDLHGEFGHLNRLISTERPEMVIQLGDLGYWPRLWGYKYVDSMGNERTWKSVFKTHDTKVYWIDGNHEDFESLKNMKADISKDIKYMKRGSTMILPDGRNALFMGGALSIDKMYRTPGYDWFPDETISERDLEGLTDDMKIDIVFSHTAPIDFNVIEDPYKYGKDVSREILGYILRKYRPSRWYFAHMHLYKQGVTNDCQWTCLSYAGHHERWWITLPERIL